MVNGQFRLVGINIQYQEVLIIGVAVAVAIGLRLLFYSTRTGVALRAVVDDPELLAMSGASPNRMSQYGWILGFVMAALAGVLLAPTQTTGISIEAMTLLVVNGYAAAIVGRLKNIPVTFVAAIAIGLAENYVINYIAAPPSPEPGAGRDPGPAHGVPVHRPGHPALGAAAGRRPADHHAGAPGGRRAGVAASPACVFFAGVPSWPRCSSTTRRSRAPPCSTLGGVVMTLASSGLSLVLLTGYSGQVSLCQFSFMGIGAFVMGKIAGGGSLLRPGGRHRDLRRGRGPDRPAHHPAPRPLPGPGHLRLRRRRGPAGSSPTPTSTAAEG